MKDIKRFVPEIFFRMSSDEIRKKSQKVGVLYGCDSYGCSLKHIDEIKSFILMEYPKVSDSDIEVCWINDADSIRNSRCTMLRVLIPVNDFITLRNKRKICIL